ncbi:lanC-like protein 3 [Amyelois transitella]|uniref:lanC-like protein 3 n=1 Tax=Amyelois transitella TaxID=680683 RepID=UPI00298FEE4C|nr:lanC-like protein 3 [Amyelois transitella]
MSDRDSAGGRKEKKKTKQKQWHIFENYRIFTINLMLKSWFKVLRFQTIGRLISNISALKMVRYFVNPYEETAIAASTLNKEEIISQINEHVENITKRLRPSRKTVDGGLYVGCTGISYMFYCLAKNPFLSEFKRIYLEKSLEYLKPALETSAGDKTSFLLGDAGTLALASVLNKESGNQFADSLAKYRALQSYYLNPKFLKCGGDEFFVGRAGYIAGALWISRELQTEALAKDELYKICDMIVHSGKEYASKHRSPCPLMYHYYNTEYLGAAHGISFILQMLMTVPGYLEHNTQAAKDIRTTVEFIASLQTEDGNWPCCMDEIDQNDHKLVHWCHGAPGTIYLMAKAYLVFKDEKYLNACIKAGKVVWQKGLLRKGPGICHGVAGNGYVFLLLYRLTGDHKYLHQATLFADFMLTDDFLRDARLPDNPESLYEGTAGTVCFLSDLIVPEKAEFPFQDVFTTF